MAILNILYKDYIEISDKISIVIPTVGEVLDNESAYYTLVSLLTAMPIDYMVLLDDMGLDFSEMNEYDLFVSLFPYVKTIKETNMIFKDLDLSKFHLASNTEDGTTAYIDVENDIVIDRRTHALIAAAIRKIHHIKKDIRNPANKEAKEYMLEVARRKARRRSRQQRGSQIEPLIVAMVNSPEFKYNFETVRNMSIYQFNESVSQVVKRVDYGNKMHGIYSGTIKPTDISKDDLNWLVH